MIKTPKFWLEKNFIAFALLPLSLVYVAFSDFLNCFAQRQKIVTKVICIGNINLGGSGKTPTALMIGKILQEIDINFAYLSRGYCGKNKENKWINLQNCNAQEMGDEPMLLAEFAPTFVAKKRLDGAKIIAQNQEIKAIILDDGMQNNSLQKDFTILVVDGKIQFGNKFIFPAGPLRQSVASGLRQADLIVVIGEIDDELRKILVNKKTVQAKIKTKNLAKFEGQKLLAFCGLAYPEKFFSHLEAQGLNVIRKIDFSDHHFYTKSDLEKLQKTAQEMGAKLVTTKKDWIKFDDNFQKQIDFLDIELELENKEFVKQELAKIFKI